MISPSKFLAVFWVLSLTPTIGSADNVPFEWREKSAYEKISLARKGLM
jgi:hypothetical protein